MTLLDAGLPGCFIIKPDLIEDERGYFAVAWAASEGEQRGLQTRVAQQNISYNRLKGTLRGMHYQSAPFGEAKLVRCTKGAVYDVVIDLRRDSPYFAKWVSCELTGQEPIFLYVAEGFAHGYQTLSDDTEVSYCVSQGYSPAHALGVRWDDPAFHIEWPLRPTVMSERDKAFADFQARILGDRHP